MREIVAVTLAGAVACRTEAGRAGGHQWHKVALDHFSLEHVVLRLFHPARHAAQAVSAAAFSQVRRLERWHASA